MIERHAIFLNNKLTQNINTINICSIELKWDGKRLKYDTKTRWDEYE